MSPTPPPLRVAIVLNPDLPTGPLANAAAVIAAGLGAARPDLGGAVLTDAEGREARTVANLPIPILQADAGAMADLISRAFPAPDGAIVVPFPDFARSVHVFEDYERLFPERSLSREPAAGLGLIGPAKWVRSLTGALKSLR